LLVVATKREQGEIQRGVDREGRAGALQKRRQPALAGAGVNCRTQNGYHGDFQIDSGRRHARGPAMHIRALDGLQFAVHVVRYCVRVSWREEDERGGGFGARG